jgi:O-antigen/teichoic acid export membrane protein
VSFENIGLSSIVIGYVLYNLVMGDLLGRKMYKNYSYYFLIQKILFVVLAFSLYSAIGSIGVLLGIALSYLIFIKRFYFTLKEVQFDLSLLKTKSSTLINFYMLEVSGKFKGQIDKLVIVPLFGFAFLGNYFLSIQIVYMLTIIPQIVMQYTLPEDASGSETKKLKIIAVVISIFLALISSIFGPTIISFLFPEFQDSVDLIPIMSLVIIPITISLMYESKFLGQEKAKFLLIGHIITISILVPGIYLLGEYFGAIGIASALLLSLSTYSLYLFIINRVISR